MWYYSFSVSEHKRRSSLNAKYINSWQLFMILFIFFFKEKVKSNLKGKKKKMPSREVSFRSACNQLPRHLNWVRSGCSIPMSKRHPFFVGGWIDPAIFFLQPHANALLFGSVFIDGERKKEEEGDKKHMGTDNIIGEEEFCVPSRSSLSRVHEILISIRPRLSVWSHPHKWGTLSVQRLCTFISHAAHTKSHQSINQKTKRQNKILILVFTFFVNKKNDALNSKQMNQIQFENLI